MASRPGKSALGTRLRTELSNNANYAAKLHKITFLYSTRSHIYLIEKTLSVESINHQLWDPRVLWETSELFTYLRFMSHHLHWRLINMPRADSEDLRLPAVWLHFFLGYDTEEMAGLLAMSVRSVRTPGWSNWKENRKTCWRCWNASTWGAGNDGGNARAPGEKISRNCERNATSIRQTLSCFNYLPVFSKEWCD